MLRLGGVGKMVDQHYSSPTLLLLGRLFIVGATALNLVSFAQTESDLADPRLQANPRLCLRKD